MRQSVGTTTLFQIVLAFTLLFSAFLAVAITYNKVFKLKNETIAIIEKYEGISSTSLEIINNYLKNNGYNTKLSCDKGEFGVSSLEVANYEKASSNKQYYYCLKSYCSRDKKSCQKNSSNIYYEVKLFFKFNLPFLGELTTFKITGETKSIKYYSENQKLQ